LRLEILHVPASAAGQIQDLTLRFGQVRPFLDPRGRGFCAMHLFKLLQKLFDL